MKKQSIVLVLVLLMAPFVVYSTEHLIPLQGYASDSSSIPVSEGNISVRVYDAATSGNLIYDSGTDFDNTITDGIFDVILGSITPLDLNNTKKYYMEVDINGEEVVGDATSGREAFWPGGGDHSHNESWNDLQDIPAGFSDGVDDTGDSVWNVSGDDVYREVGNVGIGTNTPDTLLSLDGIPVISVDTTDGNDNNFLGLAGAGDATVWRGAYMYLHGNEQNPYGGSVVIYAGYDPASTDGAHEGMIIFKTGPGASSTERMRIERDGNIGIGTETPNSTLEVVGIIHSASGGIKFPDGTIQTTAGAGGWQLTGNAGTNPSTDFLGTSDNQSFEIRVNKERALRIEPNSKSPNIIGGYFKNSVDQDIAGATIGGGGDASMNNRITGNYGTIGGGRGNLVGGLVRRYSLQYYSYPGEFSTIAGGDGNTVDGIAGFIGGGEGNKVTNTTKYGLVVGGVNNRVGNLEEYSTSGYLSTIVGGKENFIEGEGDFIGGGISNNITYESGWSVIAGGKDNTVASSDAGTICGGAYNRVGEHQFGMFALSEYSAICGGIYNIVEGDKGFIGGGSFNEVYGEENTVAGGLGNYVTGRNSFIGGGYVNKITTGWGSYNVIAGGEENLIEGPLMGILYYGTISGGTNNVVSDSGATISGGEYNNASGWVATIGGGMNNWASNESTTIGGGRNNVVTSAFGTVGGGTNNNVTGAFAVIAGGGAKDFAGNPLPNVASGVAGAICGGYLNTVSGQASFVGGGEDNLASGILSTVPGGLSNTAAGFTSFAAGRRAKANHDGTFVWADSTDADFSSTKNNQFLIRASNGTGIGTNNPTHQLTVQSTDDDTLRLIGPDSYGHGARINFGDADYVYIEEDTDDNLYIYGRYNTALMGGNVGIGTTSPSYKLDVEGYIQSYGTYTGDIFFQKDGEKLWRMFEDKEGLYVEKLKTSEVFELVLQKKDSADMSELQARIEVLEGQIGELLETQN